jgi:hypothetical protein
MRKATLRGDIFHDISQVVGVMAKDLVRQFCCGGPNADALHRIFGAVSPDRTLFSPTVGRLGGIAAAIRKPKATFFITSN